MHHKGDTWISKKKNGDTKKRGARFGFRMQGFIILKVGCDGQLHAQHLTGDRLNVPRKFYTRQLMHRRIHLYGGGRGVRSWTVARGMHAMFINRERMGARGGMRTWDANMSMTTNGLKNPPNLCVSLESDTCMHNET